MRKIKTTNRVKTQKGVINRGTMVSSSHDLDFMTEINHRNLKI